MYAAVTPLSTLTMFSVPFAARCRTKNVAASAMSAGTTFTPSTVRLREFVGREPARERFAFGGTGEVTCRIGVRLMDCDRGMKSVKKDVG